LILELPGGSENDRLKKQMRHALLNSPLLKILLLLGAALAVCCGCASTTRPMTDNDPHLPAPQSVGQRAYLGLPAELARFSYEDVQAEILVIDFFDMYCHICQTEAGHMNEFYNLVQNRALGDRLKIIGVGVGDTPLEVKLFKEKCKLPFPVFPDRAGAFTEQFGKIRVPNLLVLKKQAGHFRVIYRASGLPDKPEELLSQLFLMDIPNPDSPTQTLSSISELPVCRDGGTQCELRILKTLGAMPDAPIDRVQKQNHSLNQ
jgi:peroxiredoxin